MSPNCIHNEMHLLPEATVTAENRRGQNVNRENTREQIEQNNQNLTRRVFKSHRHRHDEPRRL